MVRGNLVRKEGRTWLVSCCGDGGVVDAGEGMVVVSERGEKQVRGKGETASRQSNLQLSREVGSGSFL